jgi:glutaredoxin
MLALLFTALLASAALDDAAKALKVGRLDGVLFALEPKEAVPASENRQAAALLVEAAQLGQARGDKPMAMQLAQMAVRRDPKNTPALKLLAEQSMRDTELRLAVKYGKQWVEADPGSAEARQFLARAEEADKSWTPPDRPKRKRGHRRTARIEPAAPAPAARAAQSGAQSGSARVILYGTAACPACNTARAWLNKKGIAFENKDIEGDRGAARELRQKRIRNRLRGDDLPVIDVNGVVLQGFSGHSIEAALQRTGG